MKQYLSQNELVTEFNHRQGNLKIKWKVRASYDEMYSWFATNKSYKEIADHFGVTRQRIQQIYSRYYQPVMDSPRQRQKARREAANAGKIKEHSKTMPHMKALRDTVAHYGLSVDAVPTQSLPNRASYYFVDINGHRCKIQTSGKTTLSTTKSRRTYWKFNCTKRTLELCEFNILICELDGETRFFVIPSQVILESNFGKRGYKTIYICSEDLEPYNNQYPEIPYWDYLASWDQLGATNAGRLS